MIEAGVCGSGSLDKVMARKHFNRALRVHKVTLFVPSTQVLRDLHSHCETVILEKLHNSR